MNNDRAKDEARTRIAEYLQSTGRPINRKFTCLSPEHQDKHPSMSFDRKQQRVHCFVCGASYDIFDLIGMDYGLQDFPAQLAKACELYHITLDDPGRGRRKPAPKAQPQPVPQQEAKPEPEEPQQYFMDYFQACAERLESPEGKPGRDYLTARGISEETAKAELIGYDPEYYFSARDEFPGGKYPAIILADSPECRIARNIAQDIPKEGRYAKKGHYSLYRGEHLQTAQKPIFVTEGELDAVSVLEAGGEAVALGSASNINRLFDAIQIGKPMQPLILALDNDEIGRNATEKLKAELEQRKIVFTLPANLYGSHKDANEFLTADREGFTASLRKAEAEAVEKWTEATTKAGLLTAARAMRVLDAVDEKYLEMPSFPQLSATVKIRTHDTVVIAADTGAGKSSLALNILHDLQDKYPAIYFNLEMDEATILQRLVAIHTGLDLTRIEGYKHDSNTRAKVDEAIREITARKEIQLFEDVSDLEDIGREIQEATRGRKEPTIVFIDTALLIKDKAHRSASRYDLFTGISQDLRQMARLNNVIMFVLLQQNRDGKNENKKPTNSSLKETGSWENDATKIIFLWDNPEQKGKELLITKNRSGATGEIQLKYKPSTQEYREPETGFRPLTEKEAKEAPFDLSNPTLPNRQRKGGTKQ